MPLHKVLYKPSYKGLLNLYIRGLTIPFFVLKPHIYVIYDIQNTATTKVKAEHSDISQTHKKAQPAKDQNC